jgi:ADP-heptose:LPS heptosyltransferase
MNRIRVLKLVDKILGNALLLVLPLLKKKRINHAAHIRKILFIRPGGIGDAVLLIPAISALKAEIPDSEIDILCERRNADIFGLLETVCRLYVYDRKNDLISCLKNHYDVVIDTEQWHRLSAAAAYITGAPVRIGYDTNERGRLFTHGIFYSQDDYEVFSFMHLVEPLLKKPSEFSLDDPFFNITTESLEEILPLPKEKMDRVVSIFPGASVAERRWGGDRYGKVAQALQDRGFTIVIAGAHSERGDADIIRSYARNSIDITGKTDLKDVSKVLKVSRLLISADSGLMHMAYAVGTPTVSLFGSGIEKKWAPRGKNHIVINKGLPCSPCTRFGYTPKCKKNVECLSLITVNEVIEAAQVILNKVLDEEETLTKKAEN